MGDTGADGGYVLHHPKIAGNLRDSYLLRNAVEATQSEFVAWGRRTVDDLNAGRISPEQVPPYLLKYYTAHLVEVQAAPEDFRALIEDGWRRAWEAFEGGFQGFSRDVQLAWDRLRDAAAGDPELLKRPAIGLGGQVRCTLCLASINSIGSNIPADLLAEFVDHGLLTIGQALHVAKLQSDMHRGRALAALAPRLTDEERPGLLAEALRAVRAIHHKESQASALVALAPQLSGELLAEALRAARIIRGERDWAPGLAALAPQLSGELLAEALRAARAVGKDRVHALAALSPQLSSEQRREALANMLQALARAGRRRALHYLNSTATALVDLGGSAAVKETAEAIRDVGAWWS